MKKNILDCFKIAGTYRIKIYGLKNHEKSRSPNVSGSKCPWGPSVAPGDTWTLGTLGPRDIWTPRLYMVSEVINKSCLISLQAYIVDPNQLSNYK